MAPLAHKTSAAADSFMPIQFSSPSVSSGKASASHCCCPARWTTDSSTAKFRSTAACTSAGFSRKSMICGRAWQAATRTVAASPVTSAALKKTTPIITQLPHHI